MLRSWPRWPARTRKRSLEIGCDISRLLSRKQIDVTAATDGLDALLLAIVGAELAPQVAHVHVNAAVHGGHGAAQRGLRQVFTADDLPRIAEKCIEQIELGASEPYGLAVASHAARVRMQINSGQVHRLRGRGRTGRGRAAQDRAQTGHKFARVEWLGQIIVRPQLQPQNAIEFAAASRQHKYRYSALLPELL